MTTLPYPMLYPNIEVITMPISAIITRIDELKPNAYTATTKLGWINHVDGAVWNEIYKYTGFSDVMRQTGIAAHALPVGVDFSLVTNVYVDGEEIFPITFKDFETTGYYRGTDGKLNIYPVPTANDVTAGLRIVYRLPFVPHVAATEEAYMPVPFDKAYDDYTAAMVDKYDQQPESYTNNVNYYNNGMKEYAAWYADHKEE